MDYHRSFSFLISPYTKRGVTIQTNYNTVNVLRTIEDVLGIDHLNFSDADAAPMADLFSQTANFTPYTSIIPGDLCAAPVDPDLVPACQNPKSIITAALPDLHNSQWWAAKTKGLDFSDADKIDSDAFNRVIWQGMKGQDVPYPAVRSGADLRKNRAELLKRWRESEAKRIAAKHSNTKKVVQTSSNQANVAASQ